MGQLEAWASLVAQLVKKSSCIEGDLGLIIGFGRSPGGGKGYPLQYSGLEKSMDCIVVLEKTLESLWTARRSTQSILKETSPEYSLERLMLKLKLQYFGYLT